MQLQRRLGFAQIKFGKSLALHYVGDFIPEIRRRLGFAQINLANLSPCTTLGTSSPKLGGGSDLHK